MFSVCSHLGGGVTQPTQPGGGGHSADSAVGVSQLGGWVSQLGGQSARGVGGSVSQGVGQLAGGWVSQPGGGVSQDRTTE